MIYKIYNILISEMFINIIVVSFLGLALRYTLSFCNQNWVRTYQQTMSYVILPVVTFAITKAIAGNIALSLGMVGALSIVRFRNPVKNSLELIMYFALVALGVVGSVDIIYAIGLIGFIILIILSSYFLENRFSMNGKSLYSFSFSEGTNANTLEVTLNKRNKSLGLNSNLIQEIHDNQEKIYIYKFASSNKKRIDEILDEVEKIGKETVKSVNKIYT
tara:strand:- start:30 stop:683 length:654 start_codon:yes stop_codon:yes gene_type:complete